MGSVPNVGLTVSEDVTTLMPVLGGDDLNAAVEYTGPLRAPIAKGDALAELVFAPEGLPETRIPLVAMDDVAKGGFLARLRTVSGLLLNRIQQGPEGAL